MIGVVSALIALIQAGLLFCLGYHYLFLVASIRQPPPAPLSSPEMVASPRQRRYFAPRQRRYFAPRQRRYFAPRQRRYSAPEQRQYSASEQRRYFAVASRGENVNGHLTSLSTGTRFAIAIPAHDEAQVLAGTLDQLRRLSYPAHLFDIHVAADHCHDDTAAVARRGGAIAHERESAPRGRKAYALQWLLDRILVADPPRDSGGTPPYDAVAIFDADSRVDTRFLAVMEGHLQTGHRALQGQHVISNPHDSLLAAMAAVDMRLNNRLRNQSRRNLGLSCRLMGDAMVFDASLLRVHGWPADSMSEDREFGYELLRHGIRVRYVPEALSLGQAASRWKQAEPQRLRWYRGVAGMQRRIAGRLLRAVASQARLGLRSRGAGPQLLALVDGLFELLMPAYSLLAALSMLNLLLVGGLGLLHVQIGGLLGLAGSALLLAGWILYPVAGLVADRAPAWAFRALLLGPAYLLWRLWISLLVRMRGDRITWIRTRRREEPTGGRDAAAT